MDRGILSEQKLLEASRDFICVRPATYANEEEGIFLKEVGSTRTGGVLNTTFVLLAPDGKTPLSGSGRSPRQAFPGDEEETLEQLVKAMKAIAKKFPGNNASPRLRPVPVALDVRNAVNVAACDNQPLVVISISDETKRKSVANKLASLVWRPEFRGRFAYVISGRASELDSIQGSPKGDAVFVVEPGTYGVDGKTLGKAKSFDGEGLERMLDAGLKKFKRVAPTNDVLKEGLRKGVTWEEESIAVREASPEISRRAQRDDREKSPRSKGRRKRARE